jgi:mRNA interferase MazF
VNYRYTDGEGSKRRPAVVVSSPAYHASKADAVIIPLTTRMSSNYFGDYDLVDWAGAGLPRRSRAKGVLATVERTTIEKLYGKLSDQDLDGIKGSIRAILDL